jgi:dTDP-glucose 4,6-dehydratase
VNPLGPRAVYDEGKRYAEALTAAYRRSHSTDTTLVRIFNVYGPNMRQGDGRAVPEFIEQALTSRPLTVTGDGLQTRSLCYIDDMVNGIVKLLHSEHPGPLNLGNPHEITINELAATILDLTGSPSGIEYIESPPDDPHRRCPDISIAREHLGWAPSVPLVEGLRRTIAWSRLMLPNPATAN